MTTEDGQNVIIIIAPVLHLTVSSPASVSRNQHLLDTVLTLILSGVHLQLPWPVLHVRPSQGRSTPDPSLPRHLLDRIQQTRRRGKRLRTEPQPSGTERR